MADKQEQPVFLQGSVREAFARMSGKVVEKVVVDGDTTTTIIRLTGVRSHLEFRGGDNITSFQLAPAPGAMLRGGSLKGCPEGLTIERAWASAFGNFYNKTIMVGESEPTFSETRLLGRTAMGVNNVRGTGQIIMAPCPGVGMSISLGGAL